MTEPMQYRRMTALDTLAGILAMIVVLIMGIPLYLLVIWPLTKLGVFKEEGSIE